jgi:hypothetical protein
MDVTHQTPCYCGACVLEVLDWYAEYASGDRRTWRAGPQWDSVQVTLAKDGYLQVNPDPNICCSYVLSEKGVKYHQVLTLEAAYVKNTQEHTTTSTTIFKEPAKESHSILVPAPKAASESFECDLSTVAERSP